MSTRGTRRSSKRKASLEAVKDTSKVTKNTFTEKDTEEHFQQGDVILMALVDQFSILDPSQANDKKNIIEGIFGSPDDLYEALRVAKLRLVYAAIEKMDDTMITLTKKKILELVHSISAPSTLDPFHRAVVLYVLLLSPWTLDVLEDMDKPEPLIVKISQVMLELSNQLQTRILDWLHVSWQETFQLELIDTDNNDKEMSPTSPTSTNLLTITTPNSASTYGYYKTNEPNSCLNFPYILNLAAKFEVLRYESAIQMRNELHDTFFRVMFEGVKCPYLVLEIRRDHLVRDTMYQLDIKSSMDLRKQLKVRFVGEEGVDEGGVQKEFFQLLIREIFDPKYGMFQMNEESGLYWFKPQTVIDDSTLEELRLMGQLLGLAVYNAVILDTHFPVAMYKRLVNENVTLDDVKQLDPPLYRSLNQILNHMTREEIEACDRAFEVDMDTFDNKGSVELVEGGSNIPLTYSNRRDFVERYVDYLFNKSCQKQLEAFQQGFDRICQDSIIKTYRPDELELLICGSSDLDFEALESSATYDGGYNSETPVVR
ncbi:hypothetical protein H4219_005319 [Mycoemilia scoparia]|uniref:HECT-type E3 ubiquitin transferase n=1 Tax=Mycoemilia scoparia TaxID=417184 RepID=A0A9W8DK25_9FUNG|nr:hypothetical protein H4219_005319 [Mycoemilia scoparia]